MSWVNIAAIALAVAAALSFGLASVIQHRAVRTTLAPHDRKLAFAQIGSLLSDRVWRSGFALLLCGTLLHVAALWAAPISLTQPINALAVPVTIVATCFLARQRPSRTMVLATGGALIGVAGIVIALSGGTSGTLPGLSRLGVAAAAIIAVTWLLHRSARLVDSQARAAPRWLAPLLLAVAGAANFAAASACFRLLAQDFAGGQPLPTTVTVSLICAVPAALGAGAWSIHQAYAIGSAPTVTAASALVDPIVAIVLGVAVLGESHQLTTARVIGMLIAGGVAAAGVIQLARLDRTSDAEGAQLTTDAALTTDVAQISDKEPDAYLARR